MKKTLFALVLLCVSLLPVACVKETTYANDPKGNFESLWKLMDEHYCFFSEKGIDWNEVYRKYAPQVHPGMTDNQLLEVLANMLGELKDGHVNLFTSFNIGRYWGFYESYPSNYSESLIRDYLGQDFRISAGYKYKVLPDNIGYIQCNSFDHPIGDGNLDQIFYYLAPCNGLIIDLRNNGGGMLTSAEALAARFVNQETLVGYMQHKTGKGHQDFSEMRSQMLLPSKGFRWHKGVAVLTNREVFSAANEFVKYMKCCPQAIVIGDRTGGGGGLPFSNQLPNGWNVRFSACPMYDVDKRSVEDGIDPDIWASLTHDDMVRGVDGIIERASQYLKAHYVQHSEQGRTNEPVTFKK